MVNLLSWPPLAFRAFRNGWQPLSSPRARLRQSAARAEEGSLNGNAAWLAAVASRGRLGDAALLDSCTAEGPEDCNALGMIRALRSSWQPLEVSYHVLSCRAGCHSDNCRQALASVQGRSSSYSHGAAQAKHLLEGPQGAAYLGWPLCIMAVQRGRSSMAQS